MANDNDGDNVRQPLIGADRAKLISYDGSLDSSGSPQPTPSPSPGSPASSITVVNSPKEVSLDFDPNGDPENPQDWPLAFKWSIVLLLSMLGFITTFTCISIVPLATTIVDDLSSSSPSSISAFLNKLDVNQPLSTMRTTASTVLLVTIWELGEAAGPLLIAPLSELHGRYVVMNIANIMLILCTVLAATATSVPTFTLARALTGLSVTANVLNPPIIGDMFPPEKRGSAVSMVFLAPMIGGAVAPGIATTIADRFSWRAVIWLAVALASICEVFILLRFKETYRPVILRRRAERERKEARLQAKSMAAEDGEEEEGDMEPVRLVLTNDAEGGEIEPDATHDFWTEMKKLREVVVRPLHVLWGSVVLTALCMMAAVLFSYYYVISVTLPAILKERYSLNSVQTGWCFVSFTLGSLLAVWFCETALDKIYVSLRDTHRIKSNDPRAAGKPEYRLPMTVVGAFICPLSIGVYGWTAELHGPLSLLLFSVAVTGAGVVFTIVPVLSYIVDAFGLYSASAITGNIVTRCLMSTFLPLAAGPLIDNYGYGWGFMAFSVLSLVLAPISVIILRYGEKWRRWSKYTRASELA
ncbi:Major facilitator superfamily domain containing protein [Naviculisporaceae sp. PSN 640]